MRFKTTAKNLRELNAKLKKQGEDFKYNFFGFLPTGTVGGYGKTRHYIAEITEGQNAGATYEDPIEISFGCDDDDFEDTSDPKHFPQSVESTLKRRIFGGDFKSWERQAQR